MVKYSMYVLIGVVFFVILGYAEFRSEFPWIYITKWWRPVGILLIILGFLIYTIGYGQERYQEGKKEKEVPECQR